jgi:hypothetical protein
VGQNTCVPVECYEDVLVIEEFERNKPGAYQLKYYAPGVGLEEHAYEIKDFYRETKPAKRTL